MRYYKYTIVLLTMSSVAFVYFYVVSHENPKENLMHDSRLALVDSAKKIWHFDLFYPDGLSSENLFIIKVEDPTMVLRYRIMGCDNGVCIGGIIDYCNGEWERIYFSIDLQTDDLVFLTKDCEKTVFRNPFKGHTDLKELKAIFRAYSMQRE